MLDLLATKRSVDHGPTSYVANLPRNRAGLGLRPPAAPHKQEDHRRCLVWAPTLNIDYHVEVDHNFYSVPYQLVHTRVEARFTAATIEVFLNGRRVATHARASGRGRFVTDV